MIDIIDSLPQTHVPSFLSTEFDDLAGSEAASSPHLAVFKRTPSVSTTVRSVVLPLTDNTHFLFDTFLPNGTAMVEFNEESLLPDDEWIEEALLPEKWQICFDQLNDVAELEDGWEGFGSKAASLSALSDAQYFLYELGSANDSIPAPYVSLDRDGAIILTWESENLYGSLSIFGDDSIAFYVEKDDRSARKGRVMLTEDLDSSLIEILAA